jgi:hypothetical protein
MEAGAQNGHQLLQLSQHPNSRLAVGWDRITRALLATSVLGEGVRRFSRPSLCAHNVAGRWWRSACSKQRHSKGDDTAQVPTVNSGANRSGSGSTAGF